MRGDIGDYLRQIRKGHRRTLIALGYEIEEHLRGKQGTVLAGGTIAERYVSRFEHDGKELAQALKNKPPGSEVLLALTHVLGLTSEQYSHLLKMIGPKQHIYNRLASQALARPYIPGEQLRQLPDRLRTPLEELIDAYYQAFAGQSPPRIKKPCK